MDGVVWSVWSWMDVGCSVDGSILLLLYTYIYIYIYTYIHSFSFHSVSGTITSGHLKPGDTLLLGPDSVGTFHPTTLKSIHRKRMNVPWAEAGQSVSVALKRVKRGSLRKGMVLLGREVNTSGSGGPVACWEFEAEILVLYHSSVGGVSMLL